MPDHETKQEVSEFPESLSVFFKGYQIGEAALGEKEGLYKVKFFNNMRSTCESEYLLVKDAAFDFTYHIGVGEVLQGEQQIFAVDTCFYKIESNNIGNKKVDKAIDVFKGLVDTLKKQKDKKTTQKPRQNHE